MSEINYTLIAKKDGLVIGDKQILAELRTIMDKSLFEVIFVNLIPAWEWPDMISDMTELSRRFPETYLDIYQQSLDDIEGPKSTIFLNGKHQVIYPEVVWPDPDPNNWE